MINLLADNGGEIFHDVGIGKIFFERNKNIIYGKTLTINLTALKLRISE